MSKLIDVRQLRKINAIPCELTCDNLISPSGYELKHNGDRIGVILMTSQNYYEVKFKYLRKFDSFYGYSIVHCMDWIQEKLRTVCENCYKNYYK